MVGVDDKDYEVVLLDHFQLQCVWYTRKNCECINILER